MIYFWHGFFDCINQTLTKIKVFAEYRNRKNWYTKNSQEGLDYQFHLPNQPINFTKNMANISFFHININDFLSFTFGFIYFWLLNFDYIGMRSSAMIYFWHGFFDCINQTLTKIKVFAEYRNRKNWYTKNSQEGLDYQFHLPNQPINFTKNMANISFFHININDFLSFTFGWPVNWRIQKL